MIFVGLHSEGTGLKLELSQTLVWFCLLPVTDGMDKGTPGDVEPGLLL